MGKMERGCKDGGKERSKKGERREKIGREGE